MVLGERVPAAHALDALESRPNQRFQPPVDDVADFGMVRGQAQNRTIVLAEDVSVDSAF